MLNSPKQERTVEAEGVVNSQYSGESSLCGVGLQNPLPYECLLALGEDVPVVVVLVDRVWLDGSPP